MGQLHVPGSCELIHSIIHSIELWPQQWIFLFLATWAIEYHCNMGKHVELLSPTLDCGKRIEVEPISVMFFFLKFYDKYVLLAF